jgi:hypothetical protein
MAKYFCSDCLAQSTDETAGPMRTVNAMGTMFLGWARRCQICGSLIKTAWLMFGFPLFPLGSYRVLTLEDSRYYSRRVPLQRGQVLVTWGIAYFVVIVILAIMASSDYQEFLRVGANVAVGCTLVFPTLMLTILLVKAPSRFLGPKFDGCLGCLAYPCFLVLVAAACVGLFWFADFPHWPDLLRVGCAFLAPGVIVILPAVLLVDLIHPKKS